VSRPPWFALVSFALIAFWFSVAPLAAPQQATRSNSANPSKRPTKAASQVSTAKAANISPPASAPPTPNPTPSCDPLQEKKKFDAANFELEDLHFDSAAAQFLQLTSSCDPAIKLRAAERFDATHAEMSKWWWQMGRHFAPFRWYHIYYPRFWWAVGIAAGVCALLIALLFSLFALIYVPQLRMVRRFWSSLAKSWPKLSPILPSGPPRAVIMTPNKLTKKTEENLFASKLQSSGIEARRTLERAGAGLQVRSVTLLSLPSDTTASLIGALPIIKGVDLSGFAKFFLYLLRFFGWRVESQVGFCPPTKSADGALLTPGRLVASASVRSAWRVKAGPWPIDRIVDDQYDIDAAALAIAVRIMGSDIVGALGFSDVESFGLFMEGLRSLQRYEDETSREQPRKSKLERWMQDSLECFRQCVSQYFNDPMPRFYMGVALAMRNQEVYVMRLQQFAPECVAAGRALAFRDLMRDPKLNSPERDRAQQRYLTESEAARPYSDLDCRPWPLLEEASRMFKSLHSEQSLQRVADYNLAQVYARRGTRKYLLLGLERLLPANPPQPPVPQLAQPAQPALEETCLNLQFDCLRESLNVRLCIAENADPAAFDAAFAKFKDIEKLIDDDIRDLAYKADLTADFLTKRGFVHYERALSKKLTEPDNGADPSPNPTAEQCLNEATVQLTAALELKQHWNPAQIYLALVRRLQSGMAEAHSEFIPFQIEQAKSRLRGKNTVLEAKIKEIQDGRLRSESDRDISGKMDKETAELKLQIKELGAAIGSLERSREEQPQKRKLYSDEADELFAVLQGNPWPPPAVAAAASTAKGRDANPVPAA
jgi:hypothetical protein